MYCDADRPPPATRTAMRYEPAAEDWLHTVTVDTMVCLSAGTV